MLLFYSWKNYLASALLLAAGAARAQGPVLLGLTPAANTRAVVRTTTVVASFSQNLTPASAAALKIFSSQRGGLRTATAPAALVGANLFFTPTAHPFVPGETVQVTVTRAATSGGGALAQARVQQFTAAVGGTGRGNFRPPALNPEPSVGYYSQGVAVGDLDGDGDLDLATANAFVTGTVSLRLNDGFGSFAPPATNAELPVGNAPCNLALGDLDGDGDLDLAVSNSADNTVSLRLNDGQGSLTAPASGALLTTGARPLGLALGDLDGDGDLDLVTANDQDGTVSVFFNSGGSGFGSAAATVAVGSSPYGVALADVDGDGDLDLLASNFTSATVSVRLNSGLGTFAPPATNADPAVAPRPGGLAVADVDGDGDADFVTANQINNVVSVRLNDGAGSFTAPPGLSDVSVGRSPYGVALADVNGDGQPDLLAANAGSGTVSLRLNIGAGYFAAPAAGSEIAVSFSALCLALGDVDGDGDLDLLAPAQSLGTVSVRLNQPLVLATAPPRSGVALAAFPNPACTAAAVTGARAGSVVVVLDALGRSVAATRAGATGTAALDLAGLARGVYVVRSGAQAVRLVVE